MSVKELSVVLPAYNEEAAIEKVIGEIVGYARDHLARFEIIVVNDGSSDNTRLIVERIQQTVSGLRLINHQRNMGYGEALRSGFTAATMEWVLLMDADGQFKIASLDAFVPYADSFDMLAGWRARRADPWQRTLFAWGYNRVVGTLFSLKVRDIGCAFKLFRRSLWQDVLPIESRDHKIFSVEWVWKAQRAGARIKELPVEHYTRSGGKSTGAQLHVVWSMFRELKRLRFGRS